TQLHCWTKTCLDFLSLNWLVSSLSRRVSSLQLKLLSSCERLLDPHKCKLHHSTVEAMICARSWVKDETSREPNTILADVDSVFLAMVVE
ncbi:hypothetical protein LINPERHAP2_LOCUS19550, partial [Linum perenne]